MRRETGRWLQMRVLYVEDLANHDDPESCVGVRKDDGEALTGEHAGRVLSREKFTVQGADGCHPRAFAIRFPTCGSAS